MKDFLLTMKVEVEHTKAAGKQELDALVLACILRHYGEVLIAIS